MAGAFKTGERFVLCKWCGERPVPPSCIRRREYACSRCRHQRPAGVAARARYNAGPRRKAVSARSNARRIFTGQGYHSMARSDDQIVAVASEEGEDGKLRGVTFIPRAMVVEMVEIGRPRARKAKTCVSSVTPGSSTS